jgi:hypothetical protein
VKERGEGLQPIHFGFTDGNDPNFLAIDSAFRTGYALG